ncbi:MAG TPA: helix-turn-helix transcriptional regulator [Pedobacter sp.]|nr:helix-turn-helix transcriptional regulator [Pedobacter sp.]
MTDLFVSKSKTVASNIRKIREFRNYTQDYLAAKIGISQNAYSKIELGYSKITLDRLFNIAAILDIKAVQLIDHESSDLIRILSEGEELETSSSA